MPPAETHSGEQPLAENPNVKVSPTEDPRAHAEPCHLHDPFDFAPPKPEGDPWSLLLEPLLRQDQIQCNVWKDEVQNLLIFAGLFSAVVTTFIIESYKTLQVDPNVAMINLLSHIATRLDGPLNSTSTFSPLSANSTPPFSPTASSIRINNFWFVSLVLSLTTALVGIISLQWLREHQSYHPNIASRDKYALFNMRSEGLKKWHVHTIFTALPLLLQSALILFLGGIVDFLGTFGHISVLIPVTVIVGCTLLFLIATTIFPTIQIMSLYFNVPFKRGDPSETRPPVLLPKNNKGSESYLKSIPPNQCPYKSPQSWAIRAIWRCFYRALDRYAPAFTRRIPYICYVTTEAIHLNWRRIARPFLASSKSLVEYDQHQTFIRYLSGAFADHTSWIDFDMTWLAIRDRYIQSAFGRSFPRRPGLPDDVHLPLYDITQGLCWQPQDTLKTDSTLAYHCFADISEWTLTYLNNRSLHDVFRQQSVYLYDLLNVARESLVDVFDFDTLFFSERRMESHDLQEQRKDVYAVLHQQNMSLFLGILSHRSGSPGWPTADRRWSARHRLEIKNRVMRYFFDSAERPLKGTGTSYYVATDTPFPDSVGFDVIDMLSISIEYRRFGHGEESFKALAWQLVDFVLWVFQHCNIEPHPSSFIHNENALESLRHSITIAGSVTRDSLTFPSDASTQSRNLDHALHEAFYSICSCIESTLDSEIQAWQTTTTTAQTQPKPSLMFVLATLYADGVLRRSSALDQDTIFCSVLFKLREYQMLTMNMDCDESVREMQFPYLERWWDGVGGG